MSLFVYLGEGETGYYTLRPGNNISIPIELYNSGSDADFSLIIDQTTSAGNTSLDISAQFLTNNSGIRVGENSTEGFMVLIVASENATDGYTTIFTIVAQSILDESNDFAVFKITITTRPPPEFTDNVKLYLHH